jgi:hypothetical protein
LSAAYFQEAIENIDNIYFVDFLRRDVEQENRLYELSSDYQKLTKIITDVMNENSKLNLVLFKDAI